jgi:acetolactate synthase-1/3 small subunit
MSSVKENAMKHTIAVLVENHFGVLARVAGLFSARGYNISSLAVGETQDPTVSRITIVAGGDLKILDQITKQLNKLIDVIHVSDLSGEDHIARELVLVKVNCTRQHRAEIMQIISTFRAKVVDVSHGHATVEVTGSEGKVDALVELMQPYGILEVARTGMIALGRDSEVSFKGSPKASAGKKKLVKKKSIKKKASKKKVTKRRKKK